MKKQFLPLLAVILALGLAGCEPSEDASISTSTAGGAMTSQSDPGETPEEAFKARLEASRKAYAAASDIEIVNMDLSMNGDIDMAMASSSGSDPTLQDSTPESITYVDISIDRFESSSSGMFTGLQANEELGIGIEGDGDFAATIGLSNSLTPEVPSTPTPLSDQLPYSVYLKEGTMYLDLSKMAPSITGMLSLVLPEGFPLFQSPVSVSMSEEEIAEAKTGLADSVALLHNDFSFLGSASYVEDGNSVTVDIEKANIMQLLRMMMGEAEDPSQYVSLLLLLESVSLENAVMTQTLTGANFTFGLGFEVSVEELALGEGQSIGFDLSFNYEIKLSIPDGSYGIDYPDNLSDYVPLEGTGTAGPGESI